MDKAEERSLRIDIAEILGIMVSRLTYDDDNNYVCIDCMFDNYQDTLNKIRNTPPEAFHEILNKYGIEQDGNRHFQLKIRISEYWVADIRPDKITIR